MFYGLAAKATCMASALAPVMAVEEEPKPKATTVDSGNFMNLDNGAYKNTGQTVKGVLDSGGSNLYTWAGAIIIALGVIAIIVAAYKLVTGLVSHGKKEVNWVIVILLFAVGGIFVFGGWNMVAGQIAGGLYSAASSWSTGA